MARYEFSDGSSNKFWDIKLDGKSFTTTYGKIGTDGQTSLKTFKDAAEATKEHDKLVAEKTKKGYALVGGGGAAAAAKPAAAAAKPAAAAAKPAAAKPAKPAAAPAGDGDRTTPRYFEFSEGTSNKFWEIRLDGTAVRTRYGKIGTGGQQTLKDFGTDAVAAKEYDKLVAEKTKKGYAEAAAPAGDDE